MLLAQAAMTLQLELKDLQTLTAQTTQLKTPILLCTSSIKQTNNNQWNLKIVCLFEPLKKRTFNICFLKESVVYLKAGIFSAAALF